MNVALTRARASLFVLGHCPTLERSDSTWKGIISDARARTCLIEADVELFTAPKAKTKALPPKPPSKPHHKAATIVQVIPDTLVAARNIGSQGAASSAPSQLSLSPAKPTSVPVPSGLVPARKSVSSLPPASLPATPAPLPNSTNQPPRHEVEVGRAPTTSEPSTGNGARPTQNPQRFTQPVKRPKQPPSIFIPKKRPANGDGAGAPPNKKRT